MKCRFVFVLLCASMLAGCTFTARLYPVQGPLSTQSPQPVYIAKLTGLFTSGDFTAILSEGEVCKGRWEQVPRPKASSTSTPAGTPPVDSMSAEWDAIYGPGFYVAHVLGARLYARATATGNKGTVLNVEMYKPDNAENNTPSAIKGVAKDNKGNVFKLAF